jgi:hypothetical protein
MVESTKTKDNSVFSSFEYKHIRRVYTSKCVGTPHLGWNRIWFNLKQYAFAFKKKGYEPFRAGELNNSDLLGEPYSNILETG